MNKGVNKGVSTRAAPSNVEPCGSTTDPFRATGHCAAVAVAVAADADADADAADDDEEEAEEEDEEEETEEAAEGDGTGHPAGCSCNCRSTFPITSAASAILTASILYARSTSISDNQREIRSNQEQ